jgi:hypothetical protein
MRAEIMHTRASAVFRDQPTELPAYPSELIRGRSLRRQESPRIATRPPLKLSSKYFSLSRFSAFV